MMKKKLTKIGKICWDDLSERAHVLPLMMKHGIEETYPTRGKYVLSSDEAPERAKGEYYMLHKLLYEAIYTDMASSKFVVFIRVLTEDLTVAIAILLQFFNT